MEVIQRKTQLPSGALHYGMRDGWPQKYIKYEDGDEESVMSSQVLNLFGGESPTKDLDEEVHKKKRKNLDIR